MARCIPCEIIIIDGGKAAGNVQATIGLMARRDVSQADAQPLIDALRKVTEESEKLNQKLQA